eukprot:m.38751 g.38751  ORF g.38751 m.38751 type:complete len:72 (+) comp32634_c0_seq3:1195-1410(+)
MGNRSYSDSQRQAAIALQYFIDIYPTIGDQIKKAIGDEFYAQFLAEGKEVYVDMTDIQADILTSNRINILS